jgi:glycosyltransferase involved in cell wall biosynthesis
VLVPSTSARQLVGNGRWLTDLVPTGISRVAVNLADSLGRNQAPLEMLAPRGPALLLPARCVGPPVRGRAGAYAWEQLILPAYAHGRLVVSLANTAPLVLRNSVVVVHDLSALQHPEWFRPTMRVYAHIVTHAATRAALVIVPTSHVADEMHHLGIPPSRVAVVPWTVDPSLRRADPSRVDTVLRELGVRQPFVVCVGWSSPRKNVGLLLEAHEEARSRAEHQLVLVGPSNPGFPPIRIGEHQNVRLLPFVADEQLTPLVSGAAALAYPSLYEGFGLPPLEAAAWVSPCWSRTCPCSGRRRRVACASFPRARATASPGGTGSSTPFPAPCRPRSRPHAPGTTWRTHASPPSRAWRSLVHAQSRRGSREHRV